MVPLAVAVGLDAYVVASIVLGRKSAGTRARRRAARGLRLAVVLCCRGASSASTRLRARDNGACAAVHSSALDRRCRRGAAERHRARRQARPAGSELQRDGGARGAHRRRLDRRRDPQPALRATSRRRGAGWPGADDFKQPLYRRRTGDAPGRGRAVRSPDEPKAQGLSACCRTSISACIRRISSRCSRSPAQMRLYAGLLRLGAAPARSGSRRAAPGTCCARRKT